MVEYFVVWLVTDMVCYYGGVDEFDVRVDLVLGRVLTYGWVVVWLLLIGEEKSVNGSVFDEGYEAAFF